MTGCRVGATEVGCSHGGSIEYVVTAWLDAVIDPCHQISKCCRKFGGREVTVVDSTNRPLDQQIAVALGRNPSTVFGLHVEWNKQVTQVVQGQNRNTDIS